MKIEDMIQWGIKEIFLYNAQLETRGQLTIVFVSLTVFHGH